MGSEMCIRDRWTRTFRVNKELNELLNSDKYYYAVDQEVYDALDLSDILNEAYEYWKSVWENEGCWRSGIFIMSFRKS